MKNILNACPDLPYSTGRVYFTLTYMQSFLLTIEIAQDAT